MQIGLVLDEASKRRSWQAGASYTALYVAEVLRHAGLAFGAFDKAELGARLTDAGGTNDLLIISAPAAFDEAECAALDAWVRAGGTLIATGAVAGLDALLGTQVDGTLADGYIELAPGAAPIRHGFAEATHAFGIAKLSVRPGDGAQPSTTPAHGTAPAHDTAPAHGAASAYGTVRDGAHQPTPHPVLTVRTLGKGAAIHLAFDLAYSLVQIQQGRPIYVDGPPAPDGSGPINDGVLKADDGVALDWVWDRDAVDGAPMFARAVADRLRELFLATLFYAVARAGEALPLIWYWPSGVTGVGHLSHDTDANVPEMAEALLAHLQHVGVPSTWCVMYPGGYEPGFYPRITAAGCEIALHYDSKTGGTRTLWGRQYLEVQYDWLRAMARVPAVSTNKDHFLRWEGTTELFRWLEELGIPCDQTLGPSKRGNVGFSRGSCHPWFPLDDAAHGNRIIDVLEICLHTQDLVLTCPYSAAPAILREAAARHGVAHFLFHPGHIKKPGIADALANAVAYGRELGFVWWTAAQINEWERRRRQVRVAREPGEAAYRLHNDGLPFAGVLRVGAGTPAEAPRTAGAMVHVDGRAHEASLVWYAGWPFWEIPIEVVHEAVVTEPRQ